MSAASTVVRLSCGETFTFRHLRRPARKCAERRRLPKKADKDPTWRADAIYTREEVEILISDERILPDRRVLYGLKALAALRHGEAASLRWSQYDAAAEPLGAIHLAKTKSGVPRSIPVHPALAKLLAAWKLGGRIATYGRRPNADDLIVPTRNETARQPKEGRRRCCMTSGCSACARRPARPRTAGGTISGAPSSRWPRWTAPTASSWRRSPTAPAARSSTSTRATRGRRSAPRSRSSRSRSARARSSRLLQRLLRPREGRDFAREGGRPQRDLNPCRLRERQVS